MTKFFLFSLFSILTFSACSQTPSTTNGNSKPASTPAPTTTTPPVYASAKPGWLVDLDEAYAISVKEKKPILANFTGSDWCGWCKRLDADVFTKPEFKEWATKNVVLLELDFPRRFQIPEKNRYQNAAMQQALGIRGYPTIWLLNLTKDPTTNQYQINGLGKTGYTPTPGQFISVMEGYIN